MRKLVRTNQFHVKSTKMGTGRKLVTLQYNTNLKKKKTSFFFLQEHKETCPWQENKTTYRKVVYKSRGLRAIFRLFGAASIQVRLLFEGGLYAKP